MTQKPCRRPVRLSGPLYSGEAAVHGTRGFTLVEVMVVSVLTAFLAVLLSSCWAGFGQSANDALARCRVAQQMNLAANTLARDLGGSLGGNGTPWESQFLAWDCSIPNTLRLCFDSPNPSTPADAPNDQPTWASPQTVITYSLVPTVLGGPDGTVQFYALVRTNQTGIPNTTFTVANYITGMTPIILNPNDPLQQQQLQIQLTFTYPTNYTINNPPITRTCNLIVSAP